MPFSIKVMQEKIIKSLHKDRFYLLPLQILPKLFEVIFYHKCRKLHKSGLTNFEDRHAAMHARDRNKAVIEYAITTAFNIDADEGISMILCRDAKHGIDSFLIQPKNESSKFKHLDKDEQLNYLTYHERSLIKEL